MNIALDPTANPTNSWHGEFPFGGAANYIAVGQNADGRLEVFYAGTGSDLYHNWQLGANQLLWAGETRFSGDSAKQIAVARNADGRLEIFYVGTNNDLYHHWQTTPNGNWAGETAFPGVKANQVVVIQNHDGRLEIFYRGTGNDLYHNWQTTPNGGWAGHTPFVSDSAQQLSVSANTDGRLEIFYVGTNNDLYHNWQSSPGSAVWVGETSFPGAKANEVQVGQNADGRLEIFYRGTGDDLYHNWQTSPSSTAWHGQTSFPADSAKQIAVGRNADGRLEIFYVGTNNDVYHNWQTTPNGNWAGENAFPGAQANQIVVGQNQDGRLEIFYRGTGDHLYHNWQISPSTTLSSANNIIFTSSCNPILGLTVNIEVTTPIVCRANSGPITGFGFQLNAYSPKNEKSAWQQYAFVLDGTELIAAINNWPLSGNYLINDQTKLLSVPSAQIAAGTHLSISLTNDSTGNITGATYKVLNGSGAVLASLTKSITSHGASDLAPIVGFELNLVGPANSESALLSSGAGTFTYQASTPLIPQAAEPACAESGYITAETANTVYGTSSAEPANTFSQTFSVTLDEREFFIRRASVRPGLPRMIPPKT